MEESGILLDNAADVPQDVIIETFIAFGIILLAELTRQGSNLQPVMGKKRPLMAPLYRTRDFDIYTTRGSAL